MSDIARDIQQLEFLKSDLEKVESSNQEIERFKKEIEQRKEQIASQHFRSIESKRYDPQKTVSSLEDEKRKIEEKYNHKRTIAIVITVVISFVLLYLCVIGGPDSFGYQNNELVLSASFITILIICIACASSKKEAINKLNTEHNHKRAESEKKAAESEKTYNREKSEAANVIKRMCAQDSWIEYCHQKISEINASLSPIQKRINQNNVLSASDKNINAVSFILNQIKTKRADSIKEALLQYDEKRSRDSIREVERMELEWARQDAQREAEKREEEARIDRELQRIRQEKIDRENEALRKDIRKSLDDIEEMKRKLDR